MKKNVLVALSLIGSPLMLHAMVLDKTEEDVSVLPLLLPEIDPSFEKTVYHVNSVEIEALRALARLDADSFEGFVNRADFDVNIVFPASEIYNILESYRDRTLLETALLLPLDKLFQNNRWKLFEEQYQDVVFLENYRRCLHRLLTMPKIDVSTREGRTPMHTALLNSNYRPLMMLLEHNHLLHINVNERGPNGMTALLLAARGGNLEQIRLLLNNPAVDPTITDDKGMSVLHAFIERNLSSTDCCWLLELNRIFAFVERGALVDSVYKYRTPFDYACAQYMETVERRRNGSNKEGEDLPWPHRVLGLLALGAHVRADHLPVLTAALEGTHPFFGHCIMLAVNGGLAEEKLMSGNKHNIDICAGKAMFGMTPFMWAAARGNLPLAQQLIRFGANPLMIDSFGNTALHYAVLNGNIAMVAYIKQIAPIAYIMKNCYERTPVDLAISSKKSRAMLLMLAE